MTFIAKFRSRLHEGGWAGIFDAFVHRLPGVRYCVLYSIYRLPFQACPGPELADPGLVVTRVDDVEGLPLLVDVQDKTSRFVERLRRGDVAYVASVEGRPVGYVWLQVTTAHVEERFGFTIRLQHGDVYDFDSFVCPEFRGRGILRTLHIRLVEDLRARSGHLALAAIIELHNKRSIRAYSFLGFRRAETHCAFMVLGRARSLRIR